MATDAPGPVAATVHYIACVFLASCHLPPSPSLFCFSRLLVDANCPCYSTLVKLNEQGTAKAVGTRPVTALFGASLHPCAHLFIPSALWRVPHAGVTELLN